jgi:hypothetical protein
MNKRANLEIITLGFGVFSIIMCLFMLELALNINTLTAKPDRGSVTTVGVGVAVVLALVLLSLGRLRVVMRSVVQQLACNLEEKWLVTRNFLYRWVPFGVTFATIALSYLAMYFILRLLNDILFLILVRNNPQSRWTEPLEYFDAYFPLLLVIIALGHGLVSTIRLFRFLRVLDQQASHAQLDTSHAI